MTIDELIKAFMDGGLSLGLLVLFGFVLLKLPQMIHDAITSAVTPLVDALHGLAPQAEKVQTELQRLTVMVASQRTVNAAPPASNSNPFGKSSFTRPAIPPSANGSATEGQP